jgi:hypothetical protein
VHLHFCSLSKSPDAAAGRTHLRATAPSISSSRRFRGYLPVACIAVLTSYWLTRNIDFGVYWHAVRGFGNHSQKLYGPGSGIGYPMIFRYPPIAYLLLWPLGILPLRWAGFIWMVGAWTAGVASVQIARKTLMLRFELTAVVLGFAAILAYCVLSIRSGNVQPYLIAMIFVALTLATRYPQIAAGLLAVCISFKLWPAFFLPCFLRRGRRAVLIWLLPAMLILWLVPIAIWQPLQYSRLIAQWYHEELRVASANSELWYFPGQSLRGILLRYTTSAVPWLRGFPDVHFLCLSTVLAVRIWLVAAGGTYLVVCGLMLRSHARTQWVWDGLLFALFSILEPFCPKSSMISLGPAILVAAAIYSEAGARARIPSAWIARRLYVLACALSLLCALLQYRPAIRFMLAIGADFYVSLLLFISLALSIGSVKTLRGQSAAALKNSCEVRDRRPKWTEPTSKTRPANGSLPTSIHRSETVAAARCSEYPNRASDFASTWLNRKADCSEKEPDWRTRGG